MVKVVLHVQNLLRTGPSTKLVKVGIGVTFYTCPMA